MKRGGRGGFILVSTLGALIVLTGLVAAISYLVRTTIIGAASKRSELTIDSLIGSGIELAGYQLFMLRRPTDAMNGQQIRMNDGVVTLFAAPEAGKIDLNGSPPELLASAWASIGAPGMKPETFAARVADYRDADSEVSEKDGAEAAQYSASGLRSPPANAPFEQVDDLQNVLGVSAAATLALKPLLTVHNPGGKVSALGASAAVIRAMPDGAQLFDKIMALRANPPPPPDRRGDPDGGGGDAMQKALGEQAELFSFEPTSAAYTVRVEVARPDARRVVEVVLTASKAREALYFITGRNDRPAR